MRSTTRQRLAPKGGPAEPEKPVITNGAALRRIFITIRETVCVIADLKSPRTTFTDDKAETLGVVWGEVCDEFGINLAGSAGKYGVVVLAAMTTIEVLGAPIAAAREEMAAKEPAKLPEPEAAAGAAPPPPTGPRAFTPGAIVPTWGKT
jgi:hypothetical protein